MTPIRKPLAAVLLLCAAGMTQGQTSTLREDDFGSLKGGRDPSLRAMYEDMAVFRLLLNRALAKAYHYPTSTTTTSAPSHYRAVYDLAVTDGKTWTYQRAGASDAAHVLPAAEGVYVPGKGVIFTVAVPPTSRHPLQATTGTSDKEPTPWDTARSELRGDKPATPGKTAEPARPPLADGLLQLLADNGKNFRRLADGESLTLVLTFRDHLDCRKCHKATGDAPFWGSSLLRPTTGQTSRSALSVAPLAGIPGQSGTPALASASGEGEKNDLLLAELHMKQKQYAQAIEQYTKALKRLYEGFGPKEKWVHADLERLLQLARICNEMAVAGLASGKQGEAERAIAMAKRFAEEAATLSETLKVKHASASGGMQMAAQR